MTPRGAMQITVPIAPGELIDRITILEIKAARIHDRDKLRNVRTELALLRQRRDGALGPCATLAALTADLKAVNETLWETEDRIRECERAGDFGAVFIEQARAVYRTNDRRAALKRRINEITGSALIEEKSYAPYD